MNYVCCYQRHAIILSTVFLIQSRAQCARGKRGICATKEPSSTLRADGGDWEPDYRK